MKAEQFIYGLYTNHGIKLTKSQGTNQLLTGDIIQYLTSQTQPGITQNLWPNGTVTVTKITDVKDEYGRRGVWNHTVAFKLTDYLAEAQPWRLVGFTDPLKEPPLKLDVLKVNV